MKSRKSDYTAVHGEPARRAHANFIITADIGGDSSRLEREQLWARQTAEFRFELCCIPFFAYNLALGDEVETDQQYVIRKLVRPSGHSTFRVWFGDSAEPLIREQVVDMAGTLGCELEWSSADLLAVDASTPIIAQELADYLYSRQATGHLTYETGRTS